jgi:hypothetical protein
VTLEDPEVDAHIRAQYLARRDWGANSEIAQLVDQIVADLDAANRHIAFLERRNEALTTAFNDIEANFAGVVAAARQGLLIDDTVQRTFAPQGGGG